MLHYNPSWFVSVLVFGLLPQSAVDASQLTLGNKAPIVRSGTNSTMANVNLTEFLFFVRRDTAIIGDVPVDLDLKNTKFWINAIQPIRLDNYWSLDEHQIKRYLGNTGHVQGFIITSPCPSADRLIKYLSSLYGSVRPVTRFEWKRCAPLEKRRCLQQFIDTWTSGWKNSKNSPQSASFDFSDGCRGGRRGEPAKQVQNTINGGSLRLASVERPPFVKFQRDVNGTITNYGGFCYEILNVLAKLNNFTYSVRIPPDNTYGTEEANKRWNGMIGMILDGQVEMGVGPFTISTTRKKVVDFTVAFYEEPTAILIPPPHENSRLFACTKPFQLQVWMALLSAMALLSVLLWFKYRCLWKIQNLSAQATSRDLRRPSLIQQFFYIFAIIVSQSGRSVPSFGHAPRLLVSIWCLCSVIFIYVYVGTLISFLSVPKLQPVISRLEDLPESELRWGVRAGTVLETLFTESKDGIYRIIGDGLARHPELVTSSDIEGFHRVANGSYAYIKEKSYLEFAIASDFAETGQCRLSVARQEFYKANFAFVLTKNSPLQALFNDKILRMLETGLTEYWRRKHWPAVDRCKEGREVPVLRSLNIHDLQSAFLILAIGLTLALIAFFGELLWHYTSKP